MNFYSKATGNPSDRYQDKRGNLMMALQEKPGAD